jgi:signal transduction histidine kinase
VESSLAFIPAVVFVAVFGVITGNERKAREQVESLAAELRQANQKLREYSAQAEELATAKERNRLAREIHDGLGHYLTAINIQIEAARAVVDTDRPRALDALDKAQTLAKESLTEVRRSVAALRAAPMANRPLPEAVGVLVEEICASGIVVEYKVTGEPRPLSPQIELALYRVVEESLTNIRKHAHATRADLILDYTAGDCVRLTVTDNGVGTSDPNSGFGLLGVRERVQMLDGTVQLTSAPGQGLTLNIEVPT